MSSLQSKKCFKEVTHQSPSDQSVIYGTFGSMQVFCQNGRFPRWLCDGSATSTRCPVDVAIGENVLHIYIYGIVCDNVTLWIHEVVVLKGLQGADETTTYLFLHFKL